MPVSNARAYAQFIDGKPDDIRDRDMPCGEVRLREGEWGDQSPDVQVRTLYLRAWLRIEVIRHDLSSGVELELVKVPGGRSGPATGATGYHIIVVETKLNESRLALATLCELQTDIATVIGSGEMDQASPIRAIATADVVGSDIG